jgi:glycosyltransferase involved in cell wall biosynthesis
MNKPDVDIVVPVWNNPTETRACLFSLASHSPGARFILVDSGSERETERLLQDFAERLDDRALLLSNNVNQGFVRAVNRGLTRSEAPCIAVVQTRTTVSAGWLEPLLAAVHADEQAGIVVPQLVNRQGGGDSRSGATLELECGSFAALLITRQVYEAVGGFDEQLDGGYWCLRDFTRRAGRAGFVTRRVPGGPVYYEEDVQLGSLRRREETAQQASRLFRERWGEGREFCVFIPTGADLETLRDKLDQLLPGARLGHGFTVILPGRLMNQAIKAGYAARHENIRLAALPRIFPGGGLRKTLARLALEKPAIIFATAVDGMPFPTVAAYIQFSELLEEIGG